MFSCPPGSSASQERHFKQASELVENGEIGSLMTIIVICNKSQKWLNHYHEFGQVISHFLLYLTQDSTIDIVLYCIIMHFIDFHVEPSTFRYHGNYCSESVSAVTNLNIHNIHSCQIMDKTLIYRNPHSHPLIILWHWLVLLLCFAIHYHGFPGGKASRRQAFWKNWCSVTVSTKMVSNSQANWGTHVNRRASGGGA